MPGALKPLGTGFLPLISAVARGLDAPIDEAVAARLVISVDLIATWNAKVDLTAARTADELADLMLADALVLARHEVHGRSVVDVGTGAGGPGLALHLVRPDSRGDPGGATTEARLLSSNGFRKRERVVFSRFAARGARARRRAGGPGGCFETSVARATLPPPDWLRLGAQLVAPKGAVWVLLAREAAPELPGWTIRIDESYVWPLTGAKRRALRYERT